MSKKYRYRVTFRDQDGHPVVMRGIVPAKFENEADAHVRSRIGIDLLAKAEFAWVEHDPEVANGQAVA